MVPLNFLRTLDVNKFLDELAKAIILYISYIQKRITF